MHFSMSPETLISIGIIAIAIWFVLVAVRQNRVRRSLEGKVHESVSQSLVVRSTAMDKPDKFDEETIKNKLRALTHRSQAQSALAHYVNGVLERHKTNVTINVLRKWMEEVGVRTDLINKIIEAKQAERRMKRLEDEEELKDVQVKTQLLEERQKQEKIQKDMRGSQELADLDLEYNKKKRRKDIADLDKGPPEPRPKPSPEETLLSKMAARRKIREQVQAEEQEELLKFRLEMRPNPAKDSSVYEDEAVWLADWREVGGMHEDFVLGEYENIKKRYRKMLDDALAELG